MYDPHAPKQIFPLQDYKFFVVGNIRHMPKIVVRSSEIRPRGSSNSWGSPGRVGE